MVLPRRLTNHEPQRDAESGQTGLLKKLRDWMKFMVNVSRPSAFRSVDVNLQSGSWYYVFKLAVCWRVPGGTPVYSAGFLVYTGSESKTIPKEVLTRLRVESKDILARHTHPG